MFARRVRLPFNRNPEVDAVINQSMLVNHYGKDGVVGRLSRALNEAGLDSDGVSWVDIAPLDQFHTRGLEATIEMAELAEVRRKAKVVDIGSGLGGPSRYLAAQFDCHVEGIDLSQEFVDGATFLAQRCGLDGKVNYRQGDALALPFESRSFDLAWTQHVAMNIADRHGLYSGIFRVLRPGGRFAAYDVTKGDGGEILFPVPWSPGLATSFVIPPKDMRATLERAGFRIVASADRSAQGVEWFDRRKARGGTQTPALGIHVAMGSEFAQMSANLERNLGEERITLTEIVAERPV